jgi:hypothetical protein
MPRSDKERVTEKVEEGDDGESGKSEAKAANFLVGLMAPVFVETSLADNEVHSVSYPSGPISTSS